ncbi:glycoside hydrolase family 32 protein [Marivirga sp. S37H4]|uniref:Glycoside hydrolase family 32 protein n=1 Tax=Marivirga aurantiaca TaxID=2802615 RepID=A0A934WWL7_9BACT|nr:glycoside hydrolase family 32 protein [Marivirga aurantiaca]MBK6264438.1 glycoside hydrolase family 32 protein [Marivirga aurantiaca]
MKKTWLLIITLLLIIACNQKEKKITDRLQYEEKYRPQYHFSPDSGWMNDPNGMVYFEGEYHLFYQYYPDSIVWGPMHWGHAVSEDLVHWNHLPIALEPDSLGYIFSGSAVIDWQNSSGFGKDNKPPIVAIYTYHDMDAEQKGEVKYQTQGIAYSNDKGRTWIKYEANPVLENPGIKDFRDPKVFWHEAENQWIMTLAVKDHVSFYKSNDLKDWTKSSDFGASHGSHKGVWECPDLFRLDDHWILLLSINPGGPNGGSATQYFIGDFDGNKFTAIDDSTRWLDYGTDNYAGVTWSDIPQSDNRRLFIGWMSNWDYAQTVPTERWRSAMTLPRELRLVENEKGKGLASIPVKELDKLRDIEKAEMYNRSEIVTSASAITLPSDKLEINMQIDQGNTGAGFEIIFENERSEQFIIGMDSASNKFYMVRDKIGGKAFSDKFDGTHFAPRVSNTPIINLRIYLDASSIEFFADDYTVVMTEILFPEKPFNQMKFESNNSNLTLNSVVVYPMKSIWHE